MDWRSKAACLSVDPELFFPIGNTGPAIAQAAEAKAVCRTCSVQTVCLQWALDNNQDSGVWGGMSEEERRSLKRRAARARRITALTQLSGGGVYLSGKTPPPRISTGDSLPRRALPPLTHQERNSHHDPCSNCPHALIHIPHPGVDKLPGRR